MSDKIMIEIKNAGNDVQIKPMGENNALVQIVAKGKVIAENITADQAASMVKQAREGVILG